jgi:hypothetical protein
MIHFNGGFDVGKHIESTTLSVGEVGQGVARAYHEVSFI